MLCVCQAHGWTALPLVRARCIFDAETFCTVAAAAAWLSLRDRGMSAAETAEFVRWLQQDPQHAAVFADLDRVWKDFDRLGAVSAQSVPDPNLLAPRVRPASAFTIPAGACGHEHCLILVVRDQGSLPPFTAGSRAVISFAP